VIQIQIKSREPSLLVKMALGDSSGTVSHSARSPPLVAPGVAVFRLFDPGTEFLVLEVYHSPSGRAGTSPHLHCARDPVSWPAHGSIQRSFSHPGVVTVHKIRSFLHGPRPAQAGAARCPPRVQGSARVLIFMMNMMLSFHSTAFVTFCPLQLKKSDRPQ
jgi:hypothetical protein